MTDIPTPPLRAVADDEPSARPGLTPASGATGRRLIDVLGDLGFVTRERIAAAVETSRAVGSPPERVLLEQGSIDADQLARAIAERYGLEHVDLDVFAIETAATQLLAPTVAARHEAVPIGFVDERTLLVAIADPANAPALEDIATRTRLEVRPVVASGDAIARLLGGEVRPPAPVVDLREAAPGASEVELARALLAEAARRGASAVHVEPNSVRLRIDGSLTPALAAYGDRTHALLAAFRALADDCRARLAVDGRSLDVVVTTLSGLDGESLVARVRDRDAPVPQLEDLGLGPEERRRVEDALAGGRGAVLLAGPAARRTDALYAMLGALVACDRRIVAVVGHASYDIPGVTQVELDAGGPRAEALRAALASDPDVVAVDELRDAESAALALEAALAGTLVLAGVPAPDGDAARARLAGLGVEAFLLEYAVEGVLALRPVGPGRR